MKITDHSGNTVEFEDLPEDIRAFLDAAGSPDRIRQRFQTGRETSLRLEAMSESLTKKYPNQWVALCGEEWVTAETFTGLLRKCDEKGFDRDLMATKLLRTQKVVRVL